jgi:hypothetical protein
LTTRHSRIQLHSDAKCCAIANAVRSIPPMDEVAPGSREPIRIQIPDESVGELAEPYQRGLHSIPGRSITVDQWGRLRMHYKMYLDQIQMNPPETGNPQLGLFESGGPGFSVRVRIQPSDGPATFHRVRHGTRR